MYFPFLQARQTPLGVAADFITPDVPGQRGLPAHLTSPQLLQRKNICIEAASRTFH